MTQEFWNIVLSRITRSQPVDLDQEFFESGPHQAAPIENIVPFNQARCLPPSKVFWTHGNGLNSCIGVRVDELLPDTTVAATRLAA
ncbi:MAG: hypothetical protein KUG69_10575, partial [Marinosulfonomonas sp.]|nr:hypothetical protein [Marinosulfonomonas sp.]